MRGKRKNHLIKKKNHFPGQKSQETTLFFSLCLGGTKGQEIKSTETQLTPTSPTPTSFVSSAPLTIQFQ